MIVLSLVVFLVLAAAVVATAAAGARPRLVPVRQPTRAEVLAELRRRR